MSPIILKSRTSDYLNTKMPQLVGKEVGGIGFGLMGFTWRPKPCPQEQAFEAMRAAIKNGSMLGKSYIHTPHTDLAGRQLALIINIIS